MAKGVVSLSDLAICHEKEEDLAFLAECKQGRLRKSISHDANASVAPELLLDSVESSNLSPCAQKYKRISHDANVTIASGLLLDSVAILA